MADAILIASISAAGTFGLIAIIAVAAARHFWRRARKALDNCDRLNGAAEELTRVAAAIAAADVGDLFFYAQLEHHGGLLGQLCEVAAVLARWHPFVPESALRSWEAQDEIASLDESTWRPKNLGGRERGSGECLSEPHRISSGSTVDVRSSFGTTLQHSTLAGLSNLAPTSATFGPHSGGPHSATIGPSSATVMSKVGSSDTNRFSKSTLSRSAMVPSGHSSASPNRDHSPHSGQMIRPASRDVFSPVVGPLVLPMGLCKPAASVSSPVVSSAPLQTTGESPMAGRGGASGWLSEEGQVTIPAGRDSQGAPSSSSPSAAGSTAPSLGGGAHSSPLAGLALQDTPQSQVAAKCPSPLLSNSSPRPLGSFRGHDHNPLSVVMRVPAHAAPVAVSQDSESPPRGILSAISSRVTAAWGQQPHRANSGRLAKERTTERSVASDVRLSFRTDQGHDHALSIRHGLPTSPTARRGEALPMEVARPRPSQLRRRKGTVIHLRAEPHHDSADETVQCLMPNLIEVLMRHEAVQPHIGAADVAATWNVHRPAPFHAQRGAQCAVDATAVNRLGYKDCGSGVSCGLLHVGITGSAQIQASVILGQPVRCAMLLARLAPVIRADSLADEQVHTGAGMIPRRVVDAVHLSKLPTTARPTLVYELLRAEPPDRGHVQGFAFLLSLQYDKATERLCEHLAHHPQDHQSRRLLLLAVHLDRQRAETHGLTMYAREYIGWESWETTLTADSVVPDAVNEVLVLAQTPDVEKSFDSDKLQTWRQQAEDVLLRRRIEEIRKERRERKARGGAPGLPPLHHGPPAPSQPDVLPRSFFDQRRRQWHRSDQVLGKGAFGEVWIGMSNEGTLVAIKALPLPREPMASPMSETPSANRFALEPAAQRVQHRRRLMQQRQQEQRNRQAMQVAADVYRSPEQDRQPLPGHVLPEETLLCNVSERSHSSRSIRSGRSVATKSAQQRLSHGGEGGVEELVREVALMVQLRHDNIVSFLGSAIERDHIFIVMEYCSGGSLQAQMTRFGRVPDAAVRRYVRDILKGLEYLHGQEVIHRDLKPQNVLVHADGQAKLADFGASVQLKFQCASQGVIGTPLYMAPEAARGAATKASDVWGLGIVVCELLSGRLPWHNEEGSPLHPHQFLFRLGRDESFLPQFPPELPAEARMFVTDCCKRDSEQRPSAAILQNYVFALQ